MSAALERRGEPREDGTNIPIIEGFTGGVRRSDVIETRLGGGIGGRTSEPRVPHASDLGSGVLTDLHHEKARHDMTDSCEHLEGVSLTDFPPPRTPDGCEECLSEGTRWVALRECLTCGHVGCCDSSPGTHATKHYQQTGHPVMRSIMPGDTWDWCYVNELTGQLA